jgi:hypothetical protein
MNMISQEEQLVIKPKRIQWLLSSLKRQKKQVILSLDGTDLFDKLHIVDVYLKEPYFSRECLAKCVNAHDVKGVRLPVHRIQY